MHRHPCTSLRTIEERRPQLIDRDVVLTGFSGPVRRRPEPLPVQRCMPSPEEVAFIKRSLLQHQERRTHILITVVPCLFSSFRTFALCSEECLEPRKDVGPPDWLCRRWKHVTATLPIQKPAKCRHRSTRKK